MDAGHFSLSVHRAVGPCERWQLQRHQDRIYGCVAWGLQLNPTSPVWDTAKGRLEFVRALKLSCPQLLELHPRLRLGVTSPKSHPVIVLLPENTPTPLLVEADNFSLGNLVNAQLDAHLDVEGQSEYLWRIVVSFDSQSNAINVVLGAHHMILDGLSGMQVLLDFIRLLSVGSVDALVKAFPVSRTDLADDVPLEQTANIIKPNLLVHLPTILGELLFPKLLAQLSPRLWSPLHEDPACDLTISARSQTRPFNKKEIRTELLRAIRCPQTLPPTRGMTFTLPNKSHLLRLARKHRATLHTALLTATQDAIAASYSLGPSATLSSQTPTSLRPDCTPQASSRPYALGCFSAGIEITGHPNKLPQSDTENSAYRAQFWADASRKKEQLRSARPFNAQRNGLLSWMPEDGWATHFLNEEKIEAPRSIFEVSNLMEWDFPQKIEVGLESGSVEFGFEEVLWSQPMNFMGPLLMLNVVSCEHTDVVYCTLSYRIMAGVREEEVEAIRKRLLHSLEVVCGEEL
ncbi:hypothetical protein BJ742DRAFT_822497 [Cladochytrium replicatum]|nr:hypothetical protein BJ742DRAFT_822497 [Cladochytrium replicatum]